MDAAVAHESEQMQLAFPSALDRLEEQWMVEKFAARNELLHACDVHAHNAASADIEMSHLAVAHLPLRKADGGAGGVDQCVGKLIEQAIVIRLARQGDGVAFRLGAVAPAVEHGQHNRFWSPGHSASEYTESAERVMRAWRRLPRFEAHPGEA